MLSHWPLVEADLHSEYGIDVEDRALMRARSWRWFQTRVTGLLAVPKSRLSRALRPSEDEIEEEDDGA